MKFLHRKKIPIKDQAKLKETNVAIKIIFYDKRKIKLLLIIIEYYVLFALV